MTTLDGGIRWPDYFAPANAPVHVRNELEIPAPVEHVWACLIRAKLWPTFYSNSRNVRFRTGTGPDLEAGTRFRWKTFGVTIESEVVEFVPRERIAWDAHSLGVDAYHAWVLRETPRGCHVLTEEMQHGFAARLQKRFLPNRMHRGHQSWLEGLRDEAKRRYPPPA
jgi:uncharacterized protein YndB with AHSA1/START domain